MEKLIDLLSAEVCEAFKKAGYEPACGKVTVSNRPDLCEFQCNGAMPAAKSAHKAPILIANDVVALLSESRVFSSAEAVNPGFINLRVREDFLAAHIEQMRRSDRPGVTGEPSGRRVVLDYGGPNVAKPLHIGHLRSAIIGSASTASCSASMLKFSGVKRWKLNSSAGPSVSWRRSCAK